MEKETMWFDVPDAVLEKYGKDWDERTIINFRASAEIMRTYGIEKGIKLLGEFSDSKHFVRDESGELVTRPGYALAEIWEQYKQNLNLNHQ